MDEPPMKKMAFGDITVTIKNESSSVLSLILSETKPTLTSFSLNASATGAGIGLGFSYKDDNSVQHIDKKSSKSFSGKKQKMFMTVLVFDTNDKSTNHLVVCSGKAINNNEIIFTDADVTLAKAAKFPFTYLAQLPH